MRVQSIVLRLVRIAGCLDFTAVKSIPKGASVDSVLLLAACLMVACGGDEFETSHWPMSGPAPEAAAGDSAGSDSQQESSADVGLDADDGAADGSPDGSEAGPETSVDAGPEAEPEAAAGDSAGDVELDAPAPEAGPDAGPEACVPETCSSLGKNCGPVSDGCGGTLQCGSCPTSETCGGGGTPNVCGGCVPIECHQVAQNCGLLEDGCGNTVDCGPYVRGHDPSCQSQAFKYKWYCEPETQWAPPPFPSGCVEADWPGSYCCVQDG